MNLGVKHHLGEPLPVPQVDENDAAVIPSALHPAHQDDFTPDVRSPQRFAVMGPAHVSQYISHRLFSFHTLPADNGAAGTLCFIQ
jgi:hypothetical protein